ncbi:MULTISPECIES: hypothetical protein [unclassified Pseudomonas]|uniref:hypothetical protein n=1 Tax=unclassified Pseudomonas TaxID=196821 RepID=UPI00131DDF7B|nr:MULTISPECIES: hypothetical protein [unclassified Pseudomonas]
MGTPRRPIVRKNGRYEQLPPGDSLLGLPLYVPAFTQAGTSLRISLTTLYALPVDDRAGKTLQVQVLLNG